MLKNTFSIKLLIGLLVTAVVFYERPMMSELDKPLVGPLTFKTDTTPYYVRSGVDYTMQPGDIYTGLQEHGLWGPYPIIYNNGKEVESLEIGAGKHIANRLYLTHGAETVAISFVSLFYDTVTLDITPYTYSELKIDPDQLNRRAGYTRNSQLTRQQLTDDFELHSYTRTGCMGGASPTYYKLERKGPNTLLTFRDQNVDTVLLIPVDYAYYRDELLAGYNGLIDTEGDCTMSYHYDIKAANQLLKLVDGTCNDTFIKRMLGDLRGRVGADNAW